MIIVKGSQKHGYNKVMYTAILLLKAGTLFIINIHVCIRHPVEYFLKRLFTQF